MPDSKGARIQSGPPLGCGDEEDWTPTQPPVRRSRRPSSPTAQRQDLEFRRPASKHRCPRCSEWILVGWDGWVMAEKAVVDAGIFLNAPGEARARERGRQTWEYVERPYVRLDQRFDETLEVAPAGELWLLNPMLVCVQHLCGRPAPQRFRYVRPRKKRLPVKPPF